MFSMWLNGFELKDFTDGRLWITQQEIDEKKLEVTWKGKNDTFVTSRYAVVDENGKIMVK